MKNSSIKIDDLLDGILTRSSPVRQPLFPMLASWMLVVFLALVAGISSANGFTGGTSEDKQVGQCSALISHNAIMDTATFASGCFWCGEAKFSQLRGVIKVTSGYTGGHVNNPSYEQVCSGSTGHAEAFNIVYDPAVITYDELLEAFFLSHDPTQLNRQGNDVGTQYRSAIFFHNRQQEERARYYINQLTQEKIYPGNIVTEVVGFTRFYNAEKYHQDYFDKNPEQSYCRYVIQPQLEKFKLIFKEKLKR